MRIVTKPKKPYVPKRPPKENPAPFIELTPLQRDEQMAEQWAKLVGQEPELIYYWVSDGE